MIELKGPGTTIATCYSAERRLDLIRYADGSWAICKDGLPLGVWEHQEQEDCFRIYERLIQMRAASRRIFILTERPRTSRLRAPSLN